jgi:hypothetical protein
LKPIHLNLAARPFRDYRPVYAVVVVLSLLTAFLMLNNIETYYRYTRETQSTRAKIATLEAQAQKERQQQAVAEQQLRGVDLALLNAKTKFVNAKLQERAFSWSVLLDELESILAPDVRLISISPSFTEEGPIDLSLQFESKSGDGLTTTLERMYSDPQFSDPFPTVESSLTTGVFRFVINVTYLPERNQRPAAGRPR